MSCQKVDMFLWTYLHYILPNIGPPHYCFVIFVLYFRIFQLNLVLFSLVCIFKCQTRTRMKSHLKIHTGEKVAACSTCGATFATNTKYMDHCSRKTPVLGTPGNKYNFMILFVVLI